VQTAAIVTDFRDRLMARRQYISLPSGVVARNSRGA